MEQESTIPEDVEWSNQPLADASEAPFLMMEPKTYLKLKDSIDVEES